MLASPGGGLTHALKVLAPKIQINPIRGAGRAVYMDKTPKRRVGSVITGGGWPVVKFFFEICL